MKFPPPGSEEMIHDWLKEIAIDQENLLSIDSYIKFFHKDITPDEAQDICIDIVDKLLAHDNVIAIVEYLGEKTEVWDFPSSLVIQTLKKNWKIYEPPKLRKGEPDFLLIDRKYLPVLEKFHSKPIIILKEPPSHKV